MIAFRADGNAQIGTGHMMRCLAIAQQIKSRAGLSPLFLCADGGEMAERAGFDCARLDGAYDDLAREDLTSCLRTHGVTTLVVDTYFADRAYYERLPEGVQVVRIFDMGDASAPCDLLLDYNINFDEFDFPNAKKLLLGPKYAPLRAEFADIGRSRKFDAVRRVLLTTGGGDEQNVTEDILRALAGQPAFDEIIFHVVLGGLNKWAARIRELERSHANIVCSRNARNMAELFLRSDAVLSAGGTTVYEICAAGAPCVVFSIADNQDRMVEVLEEKGIMLSAGSLLEDKKAGVAGVVRQLKRLIDDRSLRERLSRAARAQVDGNGAGRVAWEILRLEEA
jgi:UDP-2,4-diacetamido-2,4,6-trideoxy-beta-L-altropyranose hydrolase